MEFEDYNTAIGPKVAGTIHLHDAFCSSSQKPDFFISLSSITSVRGTPAQSNYSAGCAFQDEFARSNSGKSHTRYVTLNVGAIDGSESILAMPVQLREILRATTIPMTYEDFFLVMEYAMGSSSSAGQLMMGFDRPTLAAARDDFVNTNPLFSMVPHPQDDATGEVTEAGSVDNIETLLKKVKSMDEAVDHLSRAIAEKFAEFLDRPVADISLDEPFARFGMDSLVSIEIKNWMTRTFRAPLQSTEVIDASSIVSLAGTLASRSALIQAVVKGVASVEGIGADTDAAGATDRMDVDLIQKARTKRSVEEIQEEQNKRLRSSTSAPVNKEGSLPRHGHSCCRKSTVLQKQPIPDLDGAMQFLLENLSPFAAHAKELKNLRKAVDDFKRPGSASRKLYDQLHKDANSPNVENWLQDQVAVTWLKRRDPVHCSSSIATHYDAQVPHTQAERAAIIATTAFRHKQALETGELEPELLGVPTCAYFWDKLYNTSRIPQLEIDKVEKYSGDYCVVLKRGHAFKVPLAEEGNNVSLDKMKAVMEAILDSAQGDESWIGILTSDVRDSWTEVHI